jgi:hypothetical protein
MSFIGFSVGLSRRLPTCNHSCQAKYCALYHRHFKPLPLPEHLQDLNMTCIAIHAMPGIQSCRIRHECLHPDKPCILPASQPLSRQVHLHELYLDVAAVGNIGCTIVPYVVWFTNLNICCPLELDHVMVPSHVPSIIAISALSGISWHINGDVFHIHRTTVHTWEQQQTLASTYELVVYIFVKGAINFADKQSHRMTALASARLSWASVTVAHICCVAMQLIIPAMICMRAPVS